jgi:mRNA-degrading endonuclease YafQ of YafQ-DinJ toxin-antitoxin module
MMRIEFTARFERAYVALEAGQTEQVDKALRLLAADPRYPSLRTKKMEGWKGIWEARASESLRLTFEMQGDTIRLRNVGLHDETLGNP